MPRKYVKRKPKLLKVIVANPKTEEEKDQMIENISKVFRELYSIREVKPGYNGRGKKKTP